MVINTHERILNAPHDKLTCLIDQLGSSQDRLWPSDRWPAMRLSSLQVGAHGGHGPISYVIEKYEQGSEITFRFTAPRGFNGEHKLTLEPISATQCRIRHVIHMRLSGKARLTWPLLFGPMHDALIEDGFDRAEAFTENKAVRFRAWTPWVRTLRWLRQVVQASR